MAAILVGDKKVVLPEYTDEYKKQYWSILTHYVKEKIGKEEITTPEDVENLLKECFSILCIEFEKAIAEIPEAAFFLFCSDLHEDSIDLWKKQIEELQLPIDEGEFAASRRILKIILEQACKLELKGHRNFVVEISEKQEVYIKHLEKLLYLGVWCVNLGEEVSLSQLFPKSKGVQIQEGDFTILTYQPYPELFKFIHQDHQRHNTNVQLSDNLNDFTNLLREELSVDYNVLSSFLNPKYLPPNYNYSLITITSLIQDLHDEFGYRKEFLSNFYRGLTVSAENVLNVGECILKNQDSRRFLFRPILEYMIDGKNYNVVGYNKWIESFMVLSMNSFPFGHCPEEWSKYNPIKKFVQRVTYEHDSVLEVPIMDFLKEKNIKAEANIKSFKTKSGNNVSIDIKGVGEIDLIFIDEINKVLYVGECKHNRSRFDVNNWKRDYSNFVREYEEQLGNKEEWVNNHLNIISEHFEILYRCSIDFQDYTVRAVFFINAPTLYMYNGKYRAFTITDLKNIINGNVVDTVFRFTLEETGETFDIGHPYFKNLFDRLNK